MNLKDLTDHVDFLLSRIDTIPEVVEWKVAEHEDVIIELVRSQLLLGRDGKGETITPGYTEDPYFETNAAAEAYKRMKIGLEHKHHQRISIPLNYPDKLPNTPNMIVTGDFHNLMHVIRTPDDFIVRSKYEDAPDIMRKYGNELTELSPLAREYFYKHYVYQPIIIHLTQR